MRCTIRTAAKEGWGSRVGLVLAMAGNAVGLGNFLRFPAEAAENGGGAFLIPYLVSFLLMGIPLLWIEWAIGRHGGQFGHHSAPGMFDRMGRASWLKYVGVFGIFTNITVAAYYCYIESWTLAYVWHSAAGTFTTEDPAAFFNRYVGTDRGSLVVVPTEALLWFLVTLGLNVWILSRGLARGVEITSMIALPLLILFGVVLAIRGLTLTTADAGVLQSPLDGLNFVWQPDLRGLSNPNTWLAATGQVFFTLSVGMGSIHCYASYLAGRDDIALNAASAGWTNEFVEIVLGGSILIPISTAYLGLEAVRVATAPGGPGGFGLGFMSLPTLFNHWGWFAPVAGTMWFGLLFFAGITSSLAMGQPVLAFLNDEFGMRRSRAALTFGAATLLLGGFTVVLYPGGAHAEFDFWTGTLSLVIFALAEALIFSHVFGIDRGWDEITRGAEIKVPRVFRFLIRYVTPVFILFILLGSLLKPAGPWSQAVGSLGAGGGWPFGGDSVIGRLVHADIAEYRWLDEKGCPTAVLVQDVTRTVLALVLIGCAVLVRQAWRRKGRAS